MCCWRRQAGTSAMLPLPTSMPRAVSPSANSRCPATASPTISYMWTAKQPGVIEAEEGVAHQRQTQSDKCTNIFTGLPRSTKPMSLSIASHA